MELRQLTYFVAVAEELHFRRAGERLHVAQPAISEQIRKLERELGVQLFARNSRSVSLTAAGAAMLEEARRALSQAEAARRAARDAQGQALGRLRIGYLPDAVPPAVPRLLRRFSAAAPGITTSLQTGLARRLLEDVREQRLDAAIVGLPAPVTGLRVVPLAEEETIVAVADTHPWARQPAIDIGGLERTPLVHLPRAVNPAFFDGVLGACRAAGVAPVLIEIAEASVENVLLAVAAGTGIAFLPASAETRFAVPGVRFCSLAPPAPTHRVALVARVDVDSTTAALLRAAGQVTRPDRALRLVA